REHLYVRGQPGDLFLSKLGAMVVDLGDFDDTGAVPVVEVAARLKKSLDVEKVTKRFYREFSDQHLAFLELIQGIDDERQRRWYASVLLNRLMFIYFLQRKYFLDNGNARYLQDKLAESRRTLGKDKFFGAFLKALFFEGFAKSEEERSRQARRLLGNIRYLNGGLFLPHQVEQATPHIHVPDQAFADLFRLCDRYSWNLNDTPGGDDNEINPDVLGYIFEKYINQKAFGAYYTRPEITEYLCEQTIFKLVLDKINAPEVAGLPAARRFDSIADLLLNLDAPLCKQLLMDILPTLSLLDPACGSGAFLVAAMRTLISLYSAVIGKIEFVHDRSLTEWLHKTRKEHPSLAYFIKKRIITDNLYGVDIMEEAVEIAKLRLF
ncbi:MAG: DNA methyltransferase, partial [Candidatus Binatia bacterium]